MRVSSRRAEGSFGEFGKRQEVELDCRMYKPWRIKVLSMVGDLGLGSLTCVDHHVVLHLVVF